MADYKDLELIVVFDGDKAKFEAAGTDGIIPKDVYKGRLVLITGNTPNTLNLAKKPQIYASDETGNGKYIPIPYSYVVGLKAGNNTIANVDKIIEFVGANGISVTADPTTGKVTFDGQSLIGTSTNGSNTSTHPDTIKGAKAYTDKVAGDLKGTQATEDTTAQTIEGAKDYADKVKSDLEGTTSDTKDSQTIVGAKKYTDALRGANNDDIDDDTVLGVKNYATQLPTALDVSIKESEGTGDIAKVYTFYQGIKIEANKIGVINIPKDLVVTSGSVVKGTWEGDEFTENTAGIGSGTAIKLVLANNETLYINAATLVDVYTAQSGAAEVQLSISDKNVISASIVGIDGSKITDNTVTKSKLASAVQASLAKADSAIQSVLSGNGVTASNYINVTDVNNDTKKKGIDAKIKRMSEVTGVGLEIDGLVSALDIYAYMKARLSVKVVS